MSISGLIGSSEDISRANDLLSRSGGRGFAAKFLQRSLSKPRNSFGIAFDDPDYASKTNAAIKRGEWEDYKKTFMPLEDMLLDRAMNPYKYWEPEQQQALQSITGAFDRQTGQVERQLKRGGLDLSDRMRGELKQRSDLQENLTKVGALNVVKNQQEQELSDITSGGLVRPSTAQ